MSSPRRPARQDGVALLEALIATVILAIGLLGAIGMQARAYAALNEAGLRAEATMCSEKLLALMAVDQANALSYAYSSGIGSAKIAPWLAETQSRIPNATVTVGVTAVSATRSQVDIHIGWQRKGGAGSPVNKHDVTSYIASSK
jgi:type IV pilus assembly protein PilV